MQPHIVKPAASGGAGQGTPESTAPSIPTASSPTPPSQISILLSPNSVITNRHPLTYTQPTLPNDNVNTLLASPRSLSFSLLNSDSPYLHVPYTSGTVASKQAPNSSLPHSSCPSKGIMKIAHNTDGPEVRCYDMSSHRND